MLNYILRAPACAFLFTGEREVAAMRSGWSALPHLLVLARNMMLKFKGEAFDGKVCKEFDATVKGNHTFEVSLVNCGTGNATADLEREKASILLHPDWWAA